MTDARRHQITETSEKPQMTTGKDAAVSSEISALQTLLWEFIEQLRQGVPLTEHDVLQRIDRENRAIAARFRNITPKPKALMKRALLPTYWSLKSEEPDLWQSWAVDDALEARLVKLLRVKPRRSASGVATITVLTKPWPCSGHCLYCPQDIRMPKSYLADEPACRRAESQWFDPYLQVTSRLEHLRAMGHNIENVELIIAGGTWDDYPLDYRQWFVTELLEALNDADSDALERKRLDRQRCYESLGISNDREELACETAAIQKSINIGLLSYNEAYWQYYGADERWVALNALQKGNWEQLQQAQVINTQAGSRLIGLAIETRPELIDYDNCAELARFGVTRVQLGVQSLDDQILKTNSRSHITPDVAAAFKVLRNRGFKIHGHYMLNLPGSDPRSDLEGFKTLIEDERYRPDELKLYPCVLVESAPLRRRVWLPDDETSPNAKSQELMSAPTSSWIPYEEAELIDLMADMVALAPPWLRISRMVRDISAHDILAGNQRANARQLVEEKARQRHGRILELRSREVGSVHGNQTPQTGRSDQSFAKENQRFSLEMDALELKALSYQTSSGTEWFLSWEDAAGSVYGYGRLTLSDRAWLREVRELGFNTNGTQGLGELGLELVKCARERAHAAGYDELWTRAAWGLKSAMTSLGLRIEA